ncbi:mitochondrial carrier domain-containing protein [Umbelopsis sp. PMI_123]|nr:mitochondrial carrier domain-containing protein [Umbelopsis sp. PMI_123]
MTVTAYLCRLTLGNNALAEPEQDHVEVDDETRHARELRQGVEKSEAEVLATVGFYNAPDAQQEAAENFAGFVLAVGSMIGNYVLCFPFVVARHRHQTVPQLFARQKFTPLGSIRYLSNQYRQEGWRALYPGFGLGLLAQGIAVTYESVLNTTLAKILGKVSESTSLLTRLSLTAMTKTLELAVYIPLHPIYRNALIVRTQTQSPYTQKVITSYTGFWRACKSDLYRFSPFSQHILRSNALPLSSVFIPSCLLSILSEKLLTIVYKNVHRFLYKSKQSEKRPSGRRQHQHHHHRPRTSSLRQSLSIEPLSSPSLTAPITASASEQPSQEKLSKSTTDETTLYSFYPEVVCGITSSMITRALVYPAETVVFRLMLQGSGVLKNDTSYTGFWNCVTTLIQEEGWWSGLYQGIGSWMAEVLLGYFILESSWVALRLTQWHLKRKYDRKVEIEWQNRKAMVREE